MAMASGSLKRVGTNKYTAMLVASGAPPRWSQNTLLRRFVDQAGLSTAFVVTDTAIPLFQSLEMNRVYAMDVPGACVKSSKGSSHYGVKNVIEVRVRFPLKVSVAKEAWPLTVPYEFLPWTNLLQQ